MYFVSFIGLGPAEVDTHSFRFQDFVIMKPED